MTDQRSRPRLLGIAAVLLLAFAVLAAAVHQDRSPLQGLDNLGHSAERWAIGHAWLVHLLLWIETGFATLGMTLLTILLVVLLLARNHRRAAAFAALAMIATSLATSYSRHCSSYASRKRNSYPCRAAG